MKWRRTDHLRVLIIVQNLSVPFDRRVWLECRSLTAAGHEVDVICPQAPGEASHEVLDRVRIHRYRPPPAATGPAGFAYEFAYCWLRTAALAAKVSLRSGIDVIQACNPPDTYFVLGAAAKALGRKFVFDHHDLCPELYRARFTNDRTSGSALKLLHALERATFATADHVISTNESYRTVAMQRGRLRPHEVTVVRTGPDLEHLTPQPVRPELRSGRDKLCCYLGVMGPQDGVDLALRAIDLLVHQRGRTDCHFTFLGGGDCFDELVGLAAELGIEEWTTFTGRVPDTVVFDHLSSADIGLCPDPKNALNDVCTMNKTLEYMAFGLPIVAFDLTETRVSAGQAARYARPNEIADFAAVLDGLLDDPDARQRMGRIGRRRVEEDLSWACQRDGYLAVYEGLQRCG
ncbi:MAG TPA: glycosyltransferase family 4 protein [Acidimicrobiales bacterium]|nr:glycosyltransferase family 4 protein [Acidimicrobiales bacterium]